MSKKNKIVAYATHFPVMAAYCQLLAGEISLEAYSELRDLKPKKRPLEDPPRKVQSIEEK